MIENNFDTKLLYMMRNIRNSCDLINPSDCQDFTDNLLTDIREQETSDDTKNVIIQALKEKNVERDNEVILNNYNAKKKILFNIAKILIVSGVILTALLLSCNIYLTLSSLLLNIITIDSAQQIYNAAHSFSSSNNVDMEQVKIIVSRFVEDIKLDVAKPSNSQVVMLDRKSISGRCIDDGF